MSQAALQEQGVVYASFMTGAAQWEEYGLGNVQGPGLPPSSTSVKVRTVKGGAKLRRRTGLAECLFYVDAHTGRVGRVLQHGGAGKGQRTCYTEGARCYQG